MVPEEELSEAAESWFIPHHMVSHNGENRIVFRCSFMYKGDNLNELLPVQSAWCAGTVRGDINGMFHHISPYFTSCGET